MWQNKTRPNKRQESSMPTLQAKMILWFLSPILKLLGERKLFLIILMKGRVVAAWLVGKNWQKDF